MSYINNVRMFVRVYELGSMSAAGRDIRVSAAVASSRIGELEKHLGIRLFNRTTRSIQPTEQGRIFYSGALKILEALEEAEAAVNEVTLNPRGSLHISAPLGVGRRLIAPFIPLFHEEYPDINVRLRMSDRKLDIIGEGIDLAFVLENLPNSDMRVRNIVDCPRVLCASPEYLKKHGTPEFGTDLINSKYSCLLLRFPGSTEFRWALQTSNGPQRFDVDGPYASDDGDVLTDWALSHRGIINKPIFDVAEYLADGRLLEVCKKSPPIDVQLACIFPHKKNQDPKVRLFIDFMVSKIKTALADKQKLYQLPR